MTRPRSSHVVVVLVAAVSLLLAGCVSVPTSGPVVEGRPAGDPVAPPNVAVLPEGPRPGDTPVAVVEGFLSSMASYEPGYPTAREFLTPSAAAAWQPESGIAVYGAGEGSRTLSATDDGVTISVRLEARLAADGTYSPVEADSRLVLDLTLAQVDGEWRIDQPPDGLVMTAFDFNREYAAYASYFFDPRYEVLVPDLTYLPVRGNVPTLLVEELLDGPSEWLAPAVRSAIDPGTGLTGGSVVQSGTVARVDLGSQVAISAAVQRDRLAAQLAWTLRQAPGVAEVAVLADGQPVSIPSSPSGVVSADAYSFYDPATVANDDLLLAIAPDGRVVRVDETAAVAVPGPLGDGTPYRSVGASLTGTRAAGVSASGDVVSVAGLSEGSDVTTLEVGGNLANPSWDRNGRIWLLDRLEGSSRVLIVDSDAEVSQVPATSIEETAVQRLVLAPDGVRVAGVYSADGVGRLLMALVLERPGGAVELGQVRDIPLSEVDAVDVAWTSATALAMLGATGDDVSPYLVELANGALSSRGQVAGARSLAASPGQPLVVGAIPEGADDPVLLRQDALQEWVPLVPGSAPTYPG